ncbi:MAG: hypothetical protein PF444_05990 [Bacteroidales bacterium]|jgi:hypothetical protein|nr:hypothetical protein [Bacteroidales bacterium]
MKYLKITVLLLYILVSSNALAITITDRDNKHVEFFVNTGKSSYTFQDGYPAVGGFAFSGGANISIFSRNNWGFSTGLMFSRYQSTVLLDGYSFSTPSVDSEDEVFNLISTFSEFNERVKTSYLRVPITLKYRHYFTRSFGIIPEIGVLLHTSLATSSTVNSGSFTTVAEYPQFGEYTIIDGMPGAGTYSPVVDETHYNWNLGVSALVNLQAFFVVSKTVLLTTGLSFDYQVNPSTGNESKHLVDYEVTSYKTATCHYNTLQSTNDAGKFRTSFIGLKIGVVYKWN